MKSNILSRSAVLGRRGEGGGWVSSCELQNFQEESLLVARVFIGFLQMYVELSAALKILENFLFILFRFVILQ